jgi:hypothetical protein
MSEPCSKMLRNVLHPQFDRVMSEQTKSVPEKVEHRRRHGFVVRPFNWHNNVLDNSTFCSLEMRSFDVLLEKVLESKCAVSSTGNPGLVAF